MNIFLSYPHKDQVKAQLLRSTLLSGGHTVWIDDQLLAGQQWQQQLADQITRADAIALALTPNWLASPYCQWEFVTAVEQGKKVIPVLLEPTNPIPDRIGQYQYADFTSGFEDKTKVQRFLDDMLRLAVVVDKSRIAGLDKEQYAANATQQQHSGTGHNINVGGSGNTVAGGNVDQSHTSVTMNGSTVSGGIVNIAGRQEFKGDVKVNYAQNPTAANDPRREIDELVKQLRATLAQLPPEAKDDAEAVESLANEAANEAHKEKPNRRLLQIKGDSLKAAADNLLAVAPIAVKIAKTLLLIN